MRRTTNAEEQQRPGARRPARRPARAPGALLVLVLLVVAPLGALFAFDYLLPAAPLVSTPHVGPESGIVRANVVYCTAGGVALPLDLYLPPRRGRRLAPVAVYIHGGGWRDGDKSWINRILPADPLVARGYVVAAVNYRLAPHDKWPAQIEDVKCAIRYLRVHAATYALDPNRIGVWGESAGGYLAALLGLAGPAAGFEGQGGWPGVSSRVQAVVTMSAPADFTALDLSLANRLLAQALLGRQPDAAFLRRVSPVTYATRAAPPFLIFHGDRDPVVAPDNARKLYTALRAAGAPATLVMVKNSGHVFAPLGAPITSPTVPEIDAQVLAFFDRTLAAR